MSKKHVYKLFYNMTIVTLTFDLINPKLIGVLSSLRPISIITYESCVINSSQENERKPFFTKVNLVTLTIDLKKTRAGQNRVMLPE